MDDADVVQGSGFALDCQRQFLARRAAQERRREIVVVSLEVELGAALYLPR